MIEEKEWAEEWDLVNSYYENSTTLFKDWIYPNKIENFKNKIVLDCGCGSGEHLEILSPYIKEGYGVDMNPSKFLLRRFSNSSKIKILKDDIATMNLKKKFDIVFCIGVIHHTQDPDSSFKNIASHVKKNGKLMIWVYSYEGNFLNRTLLECIKRTFLRKIDRKTLLLLAKIITIALYIPTYSIYLLPLQFLPFYEYFDNWRKLTYRMNVLNVFDKLNAPVTHFIKKNTINKWFNGGFKKICIYGYKGVSWRASGTKE